LAIFYHGSSQFTRQYLKVAIKQTIVTLDFEPAILNMPGALSPEQTKNTSHSVTGMTVSCTEISGGWRLVSA